MLDARHIIVISVLAVLELDHSKTKILPAESCENVQENRWSFVLSMCVCMVLKFSFVMIMMYIKHPTCLLYTSPSPRDISGSRMPSSD